jgi:hypothetical protein
VATDDDPRADETYLWYMTVYAAILPLVGLDVYWMATRSGPARWLRALEARVLDGKWSPLLTLAVLVLVELLLLRLAVRVIARRRRGR